MANPQDLEDFAAGLGGGAYSPQQGSVLPNVGAPPAGPSALGLPPSAPPQQSPFPALPPINAPVQPPPLRSLGGPAPQVDVGALLNQRLQAVQGFNPQTSSWAQKGDYYRMLEELPALSHVAGIKSQDRQMQQQYMKESASQLEKFNALPPEQQATMRPFMTNYLRNTSKLAGMDLTDQDIGHALTSPDFANTYASIVNDPLLPPQQQQAYLSRIGAAPAGKERDAAASLAKKEIEEQAASLIQTHLPAIVQQMGGSPDKPVDVQTLLANPTVKQYANQSPTLKRVLNSFLSDKNNAEALAQWGIKPGKVDVARMEQMAKGPEVTGEIKDVLATMKGPDGKPLTPATVMALPNGPAIMQQAQQQVFNNKLDIAKAQGYNAVIAKSEGERKIPLVQVPGMNDVHVVNKNSEMPVDRLMTTIDDLREKGGEEKFAVMNSKSYEAFAAAKESDAILGQYLDLSKALTSTPGANFGQALTMYAKTKMGVENPGVAFDALQGTILRMARAMQGSSQSLSNLDANSVSSMLPTKYDSAPTAIQRLEVAARIVQNMKDVQLGKMPPGTLLEKIAEAKRDIAKMTGVDVYKNDKGQSVAVPRGQSHPGKGWEKQ